MGESLAEAMTMTLTMTLTMIRLSKRRLQRRFRIVASFVALAVLAVTRAFLQPSSATSLKVVLAIAARFVTLAALAVTRAFLKPSSATSPKVVLATRNALLIRPRWYSSDLDGPPKSVGKVWDNCE